MGTNLNVSGAKLARIAAICVAVFAVASVAAAVGYPSWMWTFVFVGLVFAPVVLVVTLAVALLGRLSRT